MKTNSPMYNANYNKYLARTRRRHSKQPGMMIIEPYLKKKKMNPTCVSLLLVRRYVLLMNILNCLLHLTNYIVNIKNVGGGGNKMLERENKSINQKNDSMISEISILHTVKNNFTI